MAAEIDYCKELQKQSLEFLKGLEDKYYAEIGKVKNKEKAHNKFWHEFLSPETRRINIELKTNSMFFTNVENLDDDDNTRTYEQIFNDEFIKIDEMERPEALKNLAYVNALYLCREFWTEQGKSYRSEDEMDEETAPETPLIWNGTETEFMQLIYGLFHAKYLSNTEKEITKLAPQFANLIRFKLGKSPDSNLSKNIHNTKSPVKIFDNMKTAFEQYSEKLKREKKEKQ